MLNNRCLWTIAALVIFAHLCLIVWLELGEAPLRDRPLQERLVVATINLRPEKKVENAAKHLPAQRKKNTPSKKQSPVKKTEPCKEISKQEEKMGSLIAQARQQLSRVGKTSKAMDQAKGVEALRIDSPEGEVENHGYYSQLAVCLKENLRLPEFGEVKVSLTLDCGGKVIQVKIVNAQNENNKRYVEKVLPKVDFPPFDKAFKSEKEHTFTITLTNDL